MIDLLANSSVVQLELGWILGIVGTMATTVATLAGIIYSLLNKRIVAQDKVIENLQADIGRLSKGCGLQGCHFKNRD